MAGRDEEGVGRADGHHCGAFDRSVCRLHEMRAGCLAASEVISHIGARPEVALSTLLG